MQTLQQTNKQNLFQFITAKLLTTILLFLFILFSYTYSFAQCDYYAYNIGIEGFICDDEGQICLEVNSLDHMGKGCHEYTIEIEFPINSFGYTDFDPDIDPNSQNDAVTIETNSQSVILRFNTLTYTVSGSKTACVSGFLQEADTEFILRVVSINDNSDVIHTTTFKLNDYVEIGAPNTITLLSDLIDSDLPSNASTQSYLINGTLVIDEDYVFYGPLQDIAPRLVMADNARIDIESEKTLQLFSTNVYACNNKWDRINVQSEATLDLRYNTKIQDAEVGVELTHQSNFYTGYSSFWNNTIGIGAFGNTPKDINLTFDNSIDFASSILRPFGISDGETGIHFESVNIALIGPSTFTLGTPIEFANLEYGIYLDNTNLISGKLLFSNCNTGIHDNNSSQILFIGDSRFYDGKYGIYSKGADETIIRRNYFNNQQTAILKKTANINESFKVLNNEFLSARYNIWATAGKSQATISQNKMRSGHNNVLLHGWGETNWLIAYNELEVFNEVPNGLNILLLNTKKAKIYNNDISVSLGSNFSILGGEDNKVGYNHNLYAYKSGLILSGSPQAEIFCNEWNLSNDSPIKIFNNCAGSSIRGNLIASSTYNLKYGSPSNTYAISSPQIFKGNIFSTSTPTSPKAIHYEPNSNVPLASRYIIGNNSMGQGDEYFPYFSSSFEEWFQLDDSSPDAICVPPGNEEEEIEKLKLAISTYRQLLNNDIGSIYNNEVLFDTQLKLARSLDKLTDLENLTLEEEELAYHLSLQNEGKFTHIDRLQQEQMSTSLTDEMALNNLHTTIEDIIAQITTITWTTIDQNTGELIIDETAKVQRDLLVQELLSNLHTINSIQGTYKEALHEILPQCQELNTIINSTTLSAHNLRQINALKFQRMTEGLNNYSLAELQLLESIASQCVGEGGEAVYTARVLYTEATDIILEVDDECITSSTSSIGLQKSPEPDITSQHNIEVSPNPASNNVVITLPSSGYTTTLIIQNSLGQQLHKIVVNQDQLEVIINTSDYPNGTYWITTNNENLTPHQFIINH